MHIKRIHEMVEKLTECAKMELDKGIDSVDTKEMGEVADIIKDLCEAEYYAKISVAMDEADYGADYDYMGAYDEHERKGYRGQRRDSRGRYMSRRGYESPMMHDEMREMEYMDGRMYYGGSTGGNSSNMGGSSSGMSGSSSGSSSGGSRGYSESGQMSSRMQRDGREGRSGESRRGYMESKEQGKDKSEKMQNLEEYAKTLTEDVTEMVQGMSPEEKALLKNKMQTLMTKIQ